MRTKNIFLKTAGFLFLAGFVFVHNASAASEIKVVSDKQPSAMLAPASAITPFTNFSLEYPGQSYFLDEVEVSYSGLGSPLSFTHVLLIAKKSPGIDKFNEERVVGFGVIQDYDGKAHIYPNIGAIKDRVSFEIAAATADDLKNFAGQTAAFTVTGLKASWQSDTGAPTISGLPVLGATHTLNSSLKVGRLSLKILPEKTDALQIREITGLEDVDLRKIVFGGFFDGVVLEETGGYYACQPAEIDLTACNFFDYSNNNTGLNLQKNSFVTLTGMRGGIKVVLPVPATYDTVSKGKTYGYSLLAFPESSKGTNPHHHRHLSQRRGKVGTRDNARD